MCLSLLGCVGNSTMEKGDVSDRGESFGRRKKEHTEEHAKVHPNGNSHQPKKTTHTAHSGEQHPKAGCATATGTEASPGKGQTKATKEAISYAGDQSPYTVLREAPRQPERMEQVRTQPKGPYPEDFTMPSQPKTLHEATVPEGGSPYRSAKAMTSHGELTNSSQYDTPQGRNGYSSPNPVVASTYMKTSQAEETTHKGQTKASYADDGSSKTPRYSTRADVGSEWELQSGGSTWSSEYTYRSPSSP